MAADGSKSDEHGDVAPVRSVDLLVATALLTRLPVPLKPEAATARNAPAVWAYPVIGALIGALTGLALAVLSALGVFPFVAAAVAMAFATILTGALHEDGLADCADGIGGGWSRERRLEIMKDSAIGAYGTLALILASLARWGVLVGMTAWSAEAAIAALSLAGAASRAPLGAIMRWVPSARAGQGLSGAVGRPPAISAFLALGLGALIAAAQLGAQGVVAALVAALAAAAMAWLAWRKLGGQTGDVLGAAQILAEIAALTVVFVVW